jgi:hypothetical protein
MELSTPILTPPSNDVYYYVQAMDLSTGTLDWYFMAPLGVTLYGPPVLASSETYVVVGGDTSYWLTSSSGEPVGTAQNSAMSVFNLMSSYGGDGDTVCFSGDSNLCCTSYNGQSDQDQQCLNGFMIAGEVARGVSAPMDYAYVGTASGDIRMILAVGPGSGSASPSSSGWTTWLGQPFAAPGVLSPDRQTLYIGSSSGTVCALDATSGAFMWTLPVNGSIVYAGILNADATLLFMSTSNGDVLAINLAGTMPNPPDTTMDMVIVAGSVMGVVVLAVVGTGMWHVRSSQRKAVSTVVSRQPSVLSSVTYGTQPLLRQ